MTENFKRFLSENKEILKKTPFYLYDKSQIENQISEFHKIQYPNKSIHFAVMANSNPEILDIIRDSGINIFVNSDEHLKLAESIGFEKYEIVFSSSAMSTELMKKVVDSGAILNLDSIEQLKIFQNNFKNRKVGIRCNLAGLVEGKYSHAGYFTGENSRLGIIKSELQQIENKELISGLHLYVGTDIFDIDYFVENYIHLTEIAKLFPSIEYLDLGGGFGLTSEKNETFNFEKFRKKITELMYYISKYYEKSIKLILEPGRIITGNSAIFICKVTDIKYRNNVQLIGVDASSVQFPRPLFYPDEVFHPVSMFDENLNLISENLINTSIFGCSTYSRDFLAKKTILPEAKIGNYIIFANAGSYCSSAYTNFLGFNRAKELIF